MYEIIVFIFVGLMALAMMPLIFGLFKLIGIFPLKLFDTYYQRNYESILHQYEEKCEELNNFKEAVYQREIIQIKVKEIQKNEKEIAVLQAKVDVLQETNETLTRAIEKTKE